MGAFFCLCEPPPPSGAFHKNFLLFAVAKIASLALLSYYLDNWESIDFDDKRKAADSLISTIKATSDRVQIEWKI